MSSSSMLASESWWQRVGFSAQVGVRALPELDADRQSSVPGLYIVGDLADAPIIKAALHQGHALGQRIAAGLGAPSEDPELLDVLIVGAGPAGVGAALALEGGPFRHRVIERELPFATIHHFPKKKLIFAEPRSLPTPGGLWFDDAPVDELVRRWEDALAAKNLPIEAPLELLGLRRVSGELHCEVQAGPGGAKRALRARRVILATGRRGNLTRLNVPGEDDEDRVKHALIDPALYAGRRLLIIGGGDSAVEAACDCAEAGAVVTLAHRGAALTRPKEKNLQRLRALASAGRLTVHADAQARDLIGDAALLSVAGAERRVPFDDALVLIGAALPTDFLRRLGVRMEGDPSPGRVAWIVSFAVFTWLFYVLKQKKGYFPFGEGDVLGAVPKLLEVDLGFRTVDASFWGTCLYSALILGFGLKALTRWPSPTQRRRLWSLIGFQWVFLFGIPELLAPLVIERPWKVYALTVPWPLSIWSLVDAPSWAGGDTLTAVLWLGVGALSAFVLIPWYVRRNGEAFCSTLCGCGGLAETVGDLFRHLAPRGAAAKRAEGAGQLILFMAVPVTLLILNDAWQFVAAGALYNVKAFAQSWYGLVVDFWLASIAGVALYPVLGNRVWCRFFCPLRAYMERLARRFAKVAILSNNKCIACGECTRHCQMGIDVMAYAQRQRELSNGDSACIQCGICVEVCPMDVLRLGERGEWQLAI
ncbi:MAG: NAD(P)-binding domain-containing protein [Deltaproteobacteria bacterium]|nr:NAD(P)-binding domain-containing protein [Deltaproteobacteria bacterium]